MKLANIPDHKGNELEEIQNRFAILNFFSRGDDMRIDSVDGKFRGQSEFEVEKKSKFWKNHFEKVEGIC